MLYCHRFDSVTHLLLFACAAGVVALGWSSNTAMACDNCGCNRNGNAASAAHDHGSDAGHQHSAAGMMSFSSDAQRPAASGLAAPITFAVVADTQGGGGPASIVPRLASDIASHNPDFSIFAGDLVGTGGISTFNQWNSATSVLAGSRFMVPGNHDLPATTNANWQSAFSYLPDSQVVPNITTPNPSDTIRGIDKMDYYFDRGNSRFISVTTDSQAGAGGPPRALDWFQSVMSLQSTKDKDHVFVYTHHSITTQPSDSTGGIEGEWWRSVAGRNEELDAPAAVALMSGHWHFYQPSRPDPLSDTLELVHGTGGGHLEGAPQHAIHGFSLITIDGPTVTAQFYGDANGSAGGFQFDDLLDEYVITQAGGAPKGELAFYQFEPGSATQDSSTSLLSKNHQLNFNGFASTFNDPQRGSVLELNGGFVDAKDTGEANLAIVSDLSIKVSAKSTAPLQGGVDNMLLAFGDADDSLDSATLAMEAANYAYQLSYTEEGRLRFAWEHDVQQLTETLSTEPILDHHRWHDIEVRRDVHTKSVEFLVDGQRLGEIVRYINSPTGSGAGSLYIGSRPDGADNFVGLLDDVIISSAPVDLPIGILGDINGDGMISGDGTGTFATDDVVAFVSRWLQTGVTSSDLNLDGITDISDWAILNDLNPSMGQAIFATLRGENAVPQPSSLLLVCLLLATLLAVGRCSPDCRRGLAATE